MGEEENEQQDLNEQAFHFNLLGENLLEDIIIEDF